jgi:hypothetical protein
MTILVGIVTALACILFACVMVPEFPGAVEDAVAKFIQRTRKS